MPERTGGLVRLDCPELRAIHDRAVADMSTHGLENPVFGAYGDGGCGTLRVVVWGAAGRTGDPSDTVDEAFDGVEGSLQPVLSRSPYPAGGDGAVLRCGEVPGEGRVVVLCVWADRGAMLFAMVPNQSQADAAALVGALRVDIVRRG